MNDKPKERPILFSAPMVRAILAGTKTQTRRAIKPDWAVEDVSGKPGWWGPARLIHKPTCQRPFCEQVDDSELACGGYELTSVYPPRSPFGGPGDRLWVREAWAPCDSPARRGATHYAADGAVGVIARNNGGESWFSRNGHTAGFADKNLHGVWVSAPKRWRPSIHMPRTLSRITLEVTDVRVERLQDISDEDCAAEGLLHGGPAGMWAFEEMGAAYAVPRHCYRALWESINGAGSWAKNPWVWVVSFKRLEE